MHRTSLLVAGCALLLVLACGGSEGAGECRDSGGHWECRDDVTQSDCRCAPALPDGGQPCTDSGQCEGLCLHTGGRCELDATGMCQAHDERHGCYEHLLLEPNPDPDPKEPRLLVTCHTTC